MGTWIEIRCENRTAATTDSDPGNRCWSHDNAGPMGEASDNRASLIQMVRGLEDEARETGWVKTRKGWFCPFCTSSPG
jgi:hypothetical protein